MSKRIRRFSFLVVFALCAAPSRAQVLYVDDSAPPGGDGSSWALALNDLSVALSGDPLPDIEQVWVAEGRYLPSPTDPTASFVLPDGVAVYGGFQGTETGLDQRDPALNLTLLDGDLNGDDQPGWVGYDDNSMHVVIDTGNGSSHLDGFTVRGGRWSPGAGLFLTADRVSLVQLVIEENRTFGGTNTGAGVEFRSSFVEVRDCVVRDNRATSGGGMFLRSPQEAFFSGCVFERNRATGGAGVEFGGIQVGHVLFRDCLFLEGNATGGGGIDMSPEAFTSLEVEGCTFEHNIVTSGGGMSVNSQDRGSLAVRDCVFRSNEATAGAGIYLYATTTTAISSEFSNCLFEDNRACGGGGIYTNTGPTAVERCVFRNNHLLISCGLGQGGGAIRADLELSLVEISNSSFSQSDKSLLWAERGGVLRAELCTFSNAGTSAPAIQLTAQSSAELADCIVWGDATNQVQALGGSSITAVHSDVRQGGAGLPGAGNFEADPLFVNAAGHDLRLTLGSPCIDAGDPALLLAGPDVGRYSRLTDGDLDGVARIDMGAHEASPIELAITGIPAPGNTLTIETSGQSGLAAFLRVDRPGQHFFPQAGTLFQSLTGGFLSHWPSAPSSVAVTVPPGFAGLYHAQAIVLENGALAFSNFVPLAF